MELQRFEEAHEAFLRHMQASAPNREPFVSFDHPFIYSDEIRYKRRVHALATEALSIEKWGAYRKSVGHILESVREACSPRVSSNLLYHRHRDASPYKSLFKVRSESEIEGLEKSLSDFFVGGSTKRSEFSTRFDSLAEYLRRNRLGSNWSFLAYLSFLADQRRYFPILPTRFEKLLHYYGVKEKIIGKVRWSRYSIILNVAAELKDRLAEYKPPDMISIQSYMWVVSYLLESDQIEPLIGPGPFDFTQELNRRNSSALENERIGLKGERQVLNFERDRLTKIGREDLVKRVRLVSDDPSHGYDILSFRSNGSPIHIEVKTTVRTKEADNGFWLSQYERNIGLTDDEWTLYRVWDVDVEPEIEELGNMEKLLKSGWEFEPSTWFVHPKQVQVELDREAR